MLSGSSLEFDRNFLRIDGQIQSGLHRSDSSFSIYLNESIRTDDSIQNMAHTSALD